MRVFESFNQAGGNCPVCKTNECKKTVLIPVLGTEEGNICQAIQFHLDCLIDILVFDEEAMIIGAKIK